jgi:uroporphyrin-III C-methyltransferase/precorrin-2 dehydrogenase/sirohydrochlorin ferrochelatase
MQYLPLSFDLRGKTVVLVGGGTVAFRKAKTLISAQAHLLVIAPDIDDAFELEFSEQIKDKSINFKQKPFSESDLLEINNCILVVAATNNLSVNEKVSKLAQLKNIPVNVVDQPQLSTVIFPSIVNRDPISIAISTGGKAPVLARLLRAKIESSIPTYYGELANIVDSYRHEVKELLPNISQRKAFWEKVLSGPVSEHLLIGRTDLAKTRIASLLDKLKSALKDNKDTKFYEGEVYLVGAGPGDPDLLSFKALRLLQQADVVLYDRLVAKEIVDLARKDAEKVYVGKSRSNHTLPQEEINDLLVRLAKDGKRVCRLKGGDPFIFGRGGEEIEKLSENAISFQVVPGITAASGCSSYAGIPLTHRDYAQSVMFVTGHRKGEQDTELNWKSMASGEQTLVFYMGLSEIRTIASRLIESGMDKNKPAALIQQGTTQNQKVVVGNLIDLPDLVEKEGIQAPTIIIVGGVVKLREKLDWFNVNN